MDFFEKSTFYQGRFVPLPDQNAKSFWEVVRWKFTSRPKPWPHWQPLLDLPITSAPQEMSATWLGHSSVLLNIEGCFILTDPVFSDRVGPFPGVGIRRSISASHTIESLPPIDVVLISHNHYDHLDAPSLRKLLSLHNPSIIVPLGNGALLRSLGYQKVIELDWWQKYSFTSSLSFHLTPALHWSRRGLWDTCRSLWGGFIIESPKLKIFFAGDTGYHAHFQMIRHRFGPMDLSLLPIGAYEPRWIMKESHMNPLDAAQAHLDLGSKQSLGIHFGTFRLTDEGIDDPVKDLSAALLEKSIDPKTFIAPTPGQFFTV